MRLESLKVRGFRSLRDVSWLPGRINVVIGPNNSGKTNLLRSLEFLQQATTGDINKALVAQGGLRSVLWDNQSSTLEWSVEIASDETSAQPLKLEDTIEYQLSIMPDLFSGSRIQHELCRAITKADQQRFKFFERDSKGAVVFDQQGSVVGNTAGNVDPEQTVLSQTSKLFSSPAVFFVYRYFKSWGIYQHFNVGLEATVRKAAITRRENRLASDGQNLITVLHTLYSTNRLFRNQLTDAMRAAFGAEFEELEFPPAEDQKVQMRVRWKSSSVSYSSSELPDGVLRFLMLIAIFANPDRGELVAIDEPEIFLHPRMLPIISELAADAAENSQIILTTHSPQLLSAIGTRNPITSVVENSGGETKLSVIEGTELSRWLKKYSLGELFLSGELEALK